MARIPFKRATATFDEVARARLCSSSSSGSEHSGAEDSSAELSDLVNSFMEKDGETEDEHDPGDPDTENNTLCSSSSSSSYGLETSEEFMLRRLLGCLDEAEDDVKTMLRNHIDLTYKHIMGISSSQQGFKRELMRQLREKGLDAGLCKTKCKKTGQFPSGDYEYIDVMLNGTCYIVEANLAGEFVIACPTDHYQSLLDLFPLIFVGEPDALKKVAQLMCNALKKSMKNCDMHIPPWRRNGYMLAKWFGSYKRTTNNVSYKTANVADGTDPSAKKMSMETPAIFQKCRVEVERKPYLRVGNLVQVFRGINL